MNETETTAGMRRRCWPQLRAGARGRAGAHARRGGARVCARMRAPVRARAREAEPTEYAVVSKPDRPWDLGSWMLDVGSLHPPPPLPPRRV